MILYRSSGKRKVSELSDSERRAYEKRKAKITKGDYIHRPETIDYESGASDDDVLHAQASTDDVDSHEIEKAYVESDDDFTRYFFKEDIVAYYEIFSMKQLSEILHHKPTPIVALIQGVIAEKYQHILDKNPTLYAFYCAKSLEELYRLLGECTDEDEETYALINLAILHLQT
jgi:hypothetical protein